MVEINGQKYDSDKPEIRQLYKDMANDQRVRDRRKGGLGLTGLAILAALATPMGRGAVVDISKDITTRIGDARTAYTYGDEGTVPYTAKRVRLDQDTTAMALGDHLGNEGYIRGVRTLLSAYITLANDLPSMESKIKAGSVITIPIYDPKNGKRLGDLIDAERAARNISN